MDQELRKLADLQHRELRVATQFWPVTAAFAGSLAVALYVRIFMSCMCGYVDSMGLLISGVALVGAWVVFVRVPPLNLATSLVRTLVVSLISFAFLNALTDVLWIGHDALFQWPF